MIQTSKQVERIAYQAALQRIAEKQTCDCGYRLARHTSKKCQCTRKANKRFLPRTKTTS